MPYFNRTIKITHVVFYTRSDETLVLMSRSAEIYRLKKGRMPDELDLLDISGTQIFSIVVNGLRKAPSLEKTTDTEKAHELIYEFLAAAEHLVRGLRPQALGFFTKSQSHGPEMVVAMNDSSELILREGEMRELLGISVLTRAQIQMVHNLGDSALTSIKNPSARDIASRLLSEFNKTANEILGENRSH